MSDEVCGAVLRYPSNDPMWLREWVCDLPKGHRGVHRVVKDEGPAWSRAPLITGGYR